MSNGTVEIWDLVFPRKMRVLVGHKTAVRSLILVDEQNLASCDSKEVRVWDMNTGTCPACFVDESNSAFISIHKPVGLDVLNICRERGTSLWSYKIGKNVSLNTATRIMKYGQKGWYLGQATVIIALSGNINQETKQLIGHSHDVVALEVYNDVLISGDTGGVIKIWDLVSTQNIQTLIGHTNSISCLLIYAPGVLASSSTDGTIKFWDMRTWTCERTLKPHRGKNVGTICFLKDGTFVSYGADNRVKFWGNRI